MYTWISHLLGPFFCVSFGISMGEGGIKCTSLALQASCVHMGSDCSIANRCLFLSMLQSPLTSIFRAEEGFHGNLYTSRVPELITRLLHLYFLLKQQNGWEWPRINRLLHRLTERKDYATLATNTQLTNIYREIQLYYNNIVYTDPLFYNLVLVANVAQQV